MIILGGIVEGANGARFEGPFSRVVSLTCLRAVLLPSFIMFHTFSVIVIITQTGRLASSRKLSFTSSLVLLPTSWSPVWLSPQNVAN